MIALELPPQLRPLVSDLAGIVTRLEECLADTDEARFVRVSCELASSAEAVGAESVGVGGAAGTGFDRAEAAARAVGEAMERYSACHVEPDRLVLASARRLGPAALRPAELGLFSSAQYLEDGFPYRPFTSDTLLRWVEGVDLATGAPAWVPAELVFLAGVAPGPEGPIGYATSSGLACAATAEDAAERGLLELLERDAFVLAWRRRRSLPRLAWGRSPALSELAERYLEPSGLEYHALDLSDVHDVPTVVGVCLGPSGTCAALGVGAAAARTVEDAWWRALAEAFASRAACRKLHLSDPGRTYADDGSDVVSFDDHIRFYGLPERVARAAFLWNGGGHRDTRSIDPLPAHPGARRSALLDRAERAGSRVLAVDVTAPDVASAQLHVLRVVAPGLCALDAPHAARFLGSPRLSGRDILTGSPAGPDSLNPDPHPFP